MCLLKFHQVSSKSDEKQKSFINSPFSVQNFIVSVESWKLYIVPLLPLLLFIHHFFYINIDFSSRRWNQMQKLSKWNFAKLKSYWLRGYSWRIPSIYELLGYRSHIICTHRNGLGICGSSCVCQVGLRDISSYHCMYIVLLIHTYIDILQNCLVWIF